MRIRSSMFAVLGILVLLSAFSVSCEDTGSGLPDDVVATLDGREVKLSSYLAYNDGEVPKTEAGKQQKLTSLLRTMLLFDLAKEKGYLNRPDVISRIQTIKNDKLADILREKIASGVDVALDELPQQAAPKGPSLDLYIIVCNSLKDAQVAREEVEEGEGFEEVAKKRSVAPSSVNGGHMGDVYLPNSDLSEGVRAMLNSLKVGEISPISKTRIGYVFFKVAGRTEPVELLERSQRAQLEDLRKQKYQAKLGKLIAELRAQTKIEYNDKTIESGTGEWFVKIDGQPMGRNMPDELTDVEKMHMPHAFVKGDQLRGMLNKNINNMLLAKEAVRRGLETTDRFLEYSWKTELETVSQIYIEDEIWKKARITDEEMKKYYDDNPDEFKVLAKAELKRILVEDPDLAEKIKKKLDEGEDFSHLAAEYSIDKSALRGGDIGVIYKGHVMEPINTIAFKLAPGAHSDVFKTKYGYEIIQVVWKREAGIAPLETIKDDLKKRLYERKKGQMVMDFYNRLAKKHKVVVNKRLMRSLGEKVG